MAGAPMLAHSGPWGRAKTPQNCPPGKFELAQAAVFPYFFTSARPRAVYEPASSTIRLRAMGIQPPHDFSETILINNSCRHSQ